MNNIAQKKKIQNIAITLLIAIFFIADRFLKALAHTRPEENIRLLGDLFSFQFVPNRYLAFSLPVGGWPLNLLIAIIIIAIAYLLGRALARKEEIVLISGLSLVFLGALSNFLDRLRFGYVIDYLYLKYFSVFNLADSMIIAGVILLIIRINRKPSV